MTEKDLNQDIKNQEEQKELNLDDKDERDDKKTEDNKDSEIEILNNKIAELNDKYLRAVAETENIKRRSILDSESIARNRSINITKNFLPLIDAIFAASIHSPDDEGIKSLVKTLESTLVKIGITKIETVGEVLNPSFHNAIQIVEEKDKKTNTIISEMQSGYMFGDTVLRSAMVVVAK